MNSLTALLVAASLNTGAANANTGSAAIEEQFATKYPCARIAWENMEAMNYGRGPAMRHALAEAWLAKLQERPDPWGVYYFIVPSECES